MALTDKALNVVTRPLPQSAIQKRPGKAGMEFSYITPDFVIDNLNEGFDYRWDTEVVYQGVHENVVVVGLKLTVHDAEGNPIAKEQFGSCEITRGLGVGEAFKGAASDALKKCATLVGLGLELYRDDEAPGGPPPAPQFKAPVTNRSVSPTVPAPRPLTPGVRPPVATPPTAPAPARPVAAPVPVPVPPRKDNPFAGSAPAALPRPSFPSVPAVQPPVAKPGPALPPSPKVNPFAAAAGASAGPNATQLNALTNLAQRKGISPSDLIAMATVVDATGNPVMTFEDLTREQAIQVIRAAQH